MESALKTSKCCEIVIRNSGDVIWLNDENGCVCRVQGIKHLTIVDERDPKNRTGYTVSTTLSPKYPGKG